MRRPGGVRRVWRVALLVVVVDLVLGDVAGVIAVGGSGTPAANGERAKPPAVVLADAEAATVAALPVRFDGTGDLDGDHHARLDMVIGRQRTGGRITSSAGTIDFVITQGDSFLRGDAGVIRRYTHSSGAASFLAGRWIEVPVAEDGGFHHLSDLSFLLEDGFHGDHFTFGPNATFDGRRAIALDDRDEPGTTIEVAATGVPVILAIVQGPPGHDRSDTTFTTHTSDVPPPVPADPLRPPKPKEPEVPGVA